MASVTVWRHRPMHSKQPFQRRIVAAFVLMTALVSGILSLGIVASVYFVEVHLVSTELRGELDYVLSEEIGQNRMLRLDSDTRFFASDDPAYAIPEQYAHLEDGFNEVFEGDDAYYAYVARRNGNTYILTQSQRDFETRERSLFAIVAAGFVLTVLGSWALGVSTARRIMSPISRLAQQVRHRDQLLPLAPPLAPEYAADEIGQLAASFDSTLHKIRQALERERLFTSDVSHELRTPLMVVASSCELLAEAPLTPREREQLARIERAGAEMHELVETFLKLARSKTNETASQQASLASLAADQVRRWSPLMADKGLDFQYIEEAPDTGKYDATLLSVVITNLIRNALHYTDRGYVRLVLERGGFRVEDSGAGIPHDKHDSIFQPFVRGPRARGDGLGLGLSLVNRICIQQGWIIELSSEEGRGACFKVSLHGIHSG